MGLAKSAERLRVCRLELDRTRALMAAGDLDGAFHHAERAHVLGQPWPGLHTAAHWLMLRIGFARGDGREIFGQIIRLTVGGLLTLIGRVPEGNTGGANVSPEKPMPVAPDLANLCGER
ncbi:MAG: DUF3703 domain-containing protein [Proteobacteria bacterium]|nr:DUF3703 domain-containing protein [Pseudomonadota bacterium]